MEAETDQQKDAALDKLQEVIQDVQFANDEGDPGMGLELGMMIFHTSTYIICSLDQNWIKIYDPNGFLDKINRLDL